VCAFSGKEYTVEREREGTPTAQQHRPKEKPSDQRENEVQDCSLPGGHFPAKEGRLTAESGLARGRLSGGGASVRRLDY